MHELKCPKCGGKIEEYDCFDSELSEEATFYFCGGCQNCNAEFIWKEKYSFSRIEDLEETFCK